MSFFPHLFSKGAVSRLPSLARPGLSCSVALAGAGNGGSLQDGAGDVLPSDVGEQTHANDGL